MQRIRQRPKVHATGHGQPEKRARRGPQSLGRGGIRGISTNEHGPGAERRRRPYDPAQIPRIRHRIQEDEHERTVREAIVQGQRLGKTRQGRGSRGGFDPRHATQEIRVGVGHGNAPAQSLLTQGRVAARTEEDLLH